MALGLGLSGGSVGKNLAFHRPQFPAVAQQNQNQIVLLLDGIALLDDEHCHQAVGSQEHHREQRQEGPLLFGCLNRHHRRVTEQSRQAPPRCAP